MSATIAAMTVLRDVPDTSARADFRFRVPLPSDADKARVRLIWPTMQVDGTAHIDVRLYRLALDPMTTRLQNRP